MLLHIEGIQSSCSESVRFCVVMKRQFYYTTMQYFLQVVSKEWRPDHSVSGREESLVSLRHFHLPWLLGNTDGI